MSEVVLVVVAHPDDEILGCGGVMARHAADGDLVRILILAEGITSRDDSRVVDSRKQELLQLQATAIQAASIIGVKDVIFGGFPDNRMDSIDLLDVVKLVEDCVAKLRPSIIYTHHHGDLNIDHQITNRAVMTAARPQPGSSVKRLLFFEIPSATGWNAPAVGLSFLPQYYVDISTMLNGGKSAFECKMKALEAYSCEMRPFPHTRSIEAMGHLAAWRGSQVGFVSAEAFEIGRIII